MSHEYLCNSIGRTHYMEVFLKAMYVASTIDGLCMDMCMMGN